MSWIIPSKCSSRNSISASKDCNFRFICSCVCSCICSMQDPPTPEVQLATPDPRHIVYILLLGAAETGKSTIMRQMKIIHSKGMSPSSLRSYRKHVLINVFNCLKQLLEAVRITSISWSSQESTSAAAFLESLSLESWNLQSDDSLSAFIPAEHASMISTVWKDRAAQMCWKRANEFSLPDSLAYFLSASDRLAHPSYTPTQDDVLRLRLPTMCVSVYDFTDGDWTFRITDVGGQRGSRRRWVRLFEGLNAIIFLAALSEYDQVWRKEEGEEDGKNRLELSLEIFEEILHYPGFDKTSLIVFLNKTDVLEQRIVTSDLRKYFSDYTGPDRDARSATAYIRGRFQTLTEEKTKSVYYHETCATDTKKTTFVFAAVRDDILWRNVREFVGPFQF